MLRVIHRESWVQAQGVLLPIDMEWCLRVTCQAVHSQAAQAAAVQWRVGLPFAAAIASHLTDLCRNCACRRKRLRQLLCDSGVAFLVVLLHGGVIMCQGMAFSVAMNSKRGNALVALLIAANFVEIKGVHKRQMVQNPVWAGRLACEQEAQHSYGGAASPSETVGRLSNL